MQPEKRALGALKHPAAGILRDVLIISGLAPDLAGPAPATPSPDNQGRTSVRDVGAVGRNLNSRFFSPAAIVTT